VSGVVCPRRTSLGRGRRRHEEGELLGGPVRIGHLYLHASIYLQGIDPEEIITAVCSRRTPMMSASAGLKL
jgi:hypothetical protein